MKKSVFLNFIFIGILVFGGLFKSLEAKATGTQDLAKIERTQFCNDLTVEAAMSSALQFRYNSDLKFYCELDGDVIPADQYLFVRAFLEGVDGKVIRNFFSQSGFIVPSQIPVYLYGGQDSDSTSNLGQNKNKKHINESRGLENACEYSDSSPSIFFNHLSKFIHKQYEQGILFEYPETVYVDVSSCGAIQFTLGLSLLNGSEPLVLFNVLKLTGEYSKPHFIESINDLSRLRISKKPY